MRYIALLLTNQKRVFLSSMRYDVDIRIRRGKINQTPKFQVDSLDRNDLWSRKEIDSMRVLTVKICRGVNLPL